jgi:MraZ protein
MMIGIGIFWESLGKVGKFMFSGEYNVTLDDTGRIALPRKLRDILEKEKVVLTKSADPCLWLYAPEQWGLFEKDIYKATDQFSPQGSRRRRHFIGSKQELDIDRQGRILVPPTLRDYAGLSKGCVVLGQIDYIEIWDEERYRAYLDASEDDFKAGLEELGERITQKKDLG